MQESNTLTQEIFDLERKFWTAMQKNDMESALSLTTFPCLLAGPHGIQAIDKEAFVKMFKSEQNMIRDFKLDESKVEVRQVAPDTAVIAYQANTTISKDGKPVNMDVADTSTWIKQNGKWVCVMHTETELSH